MNLLGRRPGLCPVCHHSMLWASHRRCWDVPLSLRLTAKGETRMLEGWWKKR